MIFPKDINDLTKFLALSKSYSNPFSNYSNPDRRGGVPDFRPVGSVHPGRRGQEPGSRSLELGKVNRSFKVSDFLQSAIVFLVPSKSKYRDLMKDFGQTEITRLF